MRKLFAEYLLEPDVFWTKRFPHLSWRIRVGVPFGWVTLLAMIGGGAGGATGWMQGGGREAISRGIQWFTLTWGSLVGILGGTIALFLLYLYLFGEEHPRGWLFGWVEGIWAFLPAGALIIPFVGLFVGWIAVVTLGAWVYVRFRPSRLLTVRMIGEGILLIGGGVWAAWETFHRAIQTMLWVMLGR